MKCPKCRAYIADGSVLHESCGWGEQLLQDPYTRCSYGDGHLQCRFPASFSPMHGPDAKYFCRYHYNCDPISGAEALERSRTYQFPERADIEREHSEKARRYCAEHGLMRFDGEARTDWVKRLTAHNKLTTRQPGRWWARKIIEQSERGEFVSGYALQLAKEAIK